MNDNSIVVHAYDWIVRDKGGDDDSTTIECWALDRYSKPYLLRIVDFPVFCYIELPLIIKGREYNWTAYQASELVELINRRLGERKIIRSDFRHCQKLYYYYGNRTFPFLRVFFKNVADMKNCKYKLDNPIETDQWGWIQLFVHEEQISVVRKLLTYKNIRFSNWFYCDGEKVDEELKISSIENEYIIEWNTMTSVPEDICKEWVTNPGVLAWDIETYSDNHLAMPDKYNNDHVVYMISAIYKKYKIEDSYQRYAIIIGDCNEIPPEKLDNCTLIKVNDELELAQAFADVINLTDPEILIGYNILGYDYPYLNHRIIRQLEPWPMMSRIVGELSKMSSNNWKSKAYGNNSMSTLNISGRISIDLLPVIKRDNKFESYTLKYVCSQFLNDKNKHDVSAEEMFTYYEKLQEAVKNYKLNASVENYHALELAKEKTTEVMEYCIRDSELCIDLMENQDVWIGLVELSNIVGVTIVEIFTKGQQVRCVSQLYDLACKKNVILNCREAPNYTFKGGSVQKPIPGLYDNVICLDFKSLYPSIIEAMNICYTTLVMSEHDRLIPDSECHVIEFDQDIDYTKPKKIKEDVEIDLSDSSSDEDELAEKEEEVRPTTQHYKIKFYKNKQGLVPLLVKNLVAERNAVRGRQKNEKNPQVKMVLEKRQLALKCSSNSCSGNTPIPCLIDGKFEYRMIEELFHDNYEVREGDIQVCTDINQHFGKEIKVWSDGGWADIHYVGRHEAPKNMARVLTHTGCVDVTRDHSLLDSNGNEVTANDVEIGDQLMHFSVINNVNGINKDNKISYFDDVNIDTLDTNEKEAYLHGVFFGYGIIDKYIIVKHDCNEILTDCYIIFNEMFSIKTNNIVIDNKQLIVKDKYVINLYNKLFYNHRQYKIVPSYLFESNYTSRMMFYIGYNNQKIQNQIGSAGMYHVIKSLGYNIEILHENNEYYFKFGYHTSKIKNIIDIYDNDVKYVYDIETSTHHFAAGVGDMIVHNSFFGFFGVQEGGKLPCLEAAMAITAKGRELIGQVGKYLKDKYEAKIVYGDSVTGDTPILCQFDNKVKYMTIEELGDKWHMYHDKQASFCNVKVWTEKGWTKINRVIRHYTNKAIYRIVTKTGCVDVTSDHSLLNIKAEKVKPIEVDIGYELLHTDLPERNECTKYLTSEEASIMGYKWASSTQKIPNIICYEPKCIKQSFLNGYYNNLSPFLNKIKLADLYYLSVEVGKNIELCHDINNINNIKFKTSIDILSNEIVDIIYLNNTSQYVYDLETDNHHFSAGIGRLVVHNTDSVMVDMNIKDSKMCNYWGELLAQEISGVKKGDRLPGKDDEYHLEAKPGLFLSPLAMEFEKAMRLYCIKPKMYAAYYVGKDGEFKKKTLRDSNGKIIKVFDELEMLTRGIPLVRRDKNKFLQMLYKKILDIIMTRGSFKDACTILIDHIDDFIHGKVDYHLLKSTRELNSHYKQPSFYMKVFADELRKQNKIVNPGDRLEFLIIENAEASLVGQKMILLSDYIDSLKTDNPYKIDYIHYIEKVIMNPLDSQLFSIGFKEVIEKLSHIQYTPGRKRIPLTLKNITEMLFYMLKNNINIMIFKKRLLEQLAILENPNRKYKFNIIQ